MTKEERLQIFNAVHPIGQEVRSFVSNTEVLETELRPTQPYSVYPRKFVRTAEGTAKITDKSTPPRLEGPFIHIQWILLAESGEQVTIPTSAVVPEEISLPQLWHKFIANRCRVQVKTFKWGRHWRNGAEVESGKVTELLDNDGVEVIICKGKEKSDGRIEVCYTLGEDPAVYRICAAPEGSQVEACYLPAGACCDRGSGRTDEQSRATSQSFSQVLQ
jgi:hypothetical protein